MDTSTVQRHQDHADGTGADRYLISETDDCVYFIDAERPEGQTPALMQAEFAGDDGSIDWEDATPVYFERLVYPGEHKRVRGYLYKLATGEGFVNDDLFVEVD